MQQQFKMEDGTKRVLEKLVARRKLKKQYEYEVQWKGFDPTQNTWMPRDKCGPLLRPLHFPSCIPCCSPTAIYIDEISNSLEKLYIAASTV